jgi:hypothetical protein
MAISFFGTGIENLRIGGIFDGASKGDGKSPARARRFRRVVVPDSPARFRRQRDDRLSREPRGRRVGLLLRFGAIDDLGRRDRHGW